MAKKALPLENLEKFAARLRAARKTAGVTQADAALRTGTTQASITRWESAGAEPGLESLRRLARLYAVTVDWLLFGTMGNEEATTPHDASLPGVEAASRSYGKGLPCRAHDPEDTSGPVPGTARAVSMAWSVLESGTGEADVLESTVQSLYKAVFGINALTEQLGIDGLPPAYRKEYLATKGGGGKVPKLSTDVDLTGKKKPRAGPGTGRRRKAS